MEIRTGGEAAKSEKERGDAMATLRESYQIGMDKYPGFLKTPGISLDTIVGVFDRISTNETKLAEAVGILDEVEALYEGTGYNKRITNRAKRTELLDKLVTL